MALALVVALAVATGCGSGSSDISVQTGTLSKAEFVKRANAVCLSVRRKFGLDFASYYKNHTPGSVGSEAVWLKEVLKRAVIPNYEERLIPEISEIGVPESEEKEVVAFLESLQQQLDEIKEQPGLLTKSPFPFKKTAVVAKKYGLDGCATAFS